MLQEGVLGLKSAQLVHLPPFLTSIILLASTFLFRIAPLFSTNANQFSPSRITLSINITFQHRYPKPWSLGNAGIVDESVHPAHPGQEEFASDAKLRIVSGTTQAATMQCAIGANFEAAILA